MTKLLGGVFKKFPHFWPRKRRKLLHAITIALNLMSTTIKSWSCLCCSRKMAFKKALPWILHVVILTFAVSLPFVQSSSSSLGYRTNMPGNRPRITSTEVARFGNEGSFQTVEDSTRQVPMGPDPLHHNNNPLGP